MIALILFALLAFPAHAHEFDPLVEYRFCTNEPVREADGKIYRRNDVLRAFKQRHPCPVTGLTTGRCDGWFIDHVIPLANGGCDAIFNLQWLPKEIKSCPGKFCKDRWERRIYKPFKVTEFWSLTRIAASPSA